MQPTHLFTNKTIAQCHRGPYITSYGWIWERARVSCLNNSLSPQPHFISCTASQIVNHTNANTNIHTYTHRSAHARLTEEHEWNKIPNYTLSTCGALNINTPHLYHIIIYRTKTVLTTTRGTQAAPATCARDLILPFMVLCIFTCRYQIHSRYKWKNERMEKKRNKKLLFNASIIWLYDFVVCYWMCRTHNAHTIHMWRTSTAIS